MYNSVISITPLTEAQWPSKEATCTQLQQISRVQVHDNWEALCMGALVLFVLSLLGIILFFSSIFAFVFHYIPPQKY